MRDNNKQGKGCFGHNCTIFALQMLFIIFVATLIILALSVLFPDLITLPIK